MEPLKKILFIFIFVFSFDYFLLSCSEDMKQDSQKTLKATQYEAPIKDSVQDCSQLSCPEIDCSRLNYYERRSQTCTYYEFVALYEQNCEDGQCIEDPLRYCRKQSGVNFTLTDECLKLEGCYDKLDYEIRPDNGKICGEGQGICNESGECILVESTAGTESPMMGQEEPQIDCTTIEIVSSYTTLCQVNTPINVCRFYSDFWMGFGVLSYRHCNHLCIDLGGVCVAARYSQRNHSSESQICDFDEETDCGTVGGRQICDCQF